MLIGVDLGPNLSVTGSLATILWLVTLRREKIEVTAWRFLTIGASAIIATNTVTDAHDEDVAARFRLADMPLLVAQDVEGALGKLAYAIACVTIFGSVATFAYPALSGLLHLDARCSPASRQPNELPRGQSAMKSIKAFARASSDEARTDPGSFDVFEPIHDDVRARRAIHRGAAGGLDHHVGVLAGRLRRHAVAIDQARQMQLDLLITVWIEVDVPWKY
jgi:hypothetical protein